MGDYCRQGNFNLIPLIVFVLCSGQNKSMENNKGSSLLKYAKESYGSCTLHLSSSRSIYQRSFKLIPHSFCVMPQTKFKYEN